MKLYTKPGACSLADHIVLRWSCLPFELTVVDAATMKSPDYLRLNPAGAVPLLVVDQWALTQNAAILNYIADTAPLTGLGGDGTARSRAEINRWIAFVNADLHPTFKPLFGSTAYLQEDALIQRSHEDARTKLRTLYTRVDAHLGPQLVSRRHAYRRRCLPVRHLALGAQGRRGPVRPERARCVLPAHVGRCRRTSRTASRRLELITRAATARDRAPKAARRTP